MKSVFLTKLLCLLVVVCLMGCANPIHIAEDYGLDVDQMANTPSYMMLPVRDARIEAKQFAPNGYEITLPHFGNYAVQQNNPAECWAACVEMALQYNGIEADQDEIVTRIKGAIRADGRDAGSIMDIVKSMIRSGSYIGVTTPASFPILSDLAFDSPVLMALRPQDSPVGHVIVVTGMKFSLWGWGPQADVVVHEFEYYDPVDGKRHWTDTSDIRSSIISLVHFRRFQ